MEVKVFEFTPISYARMSMKDGDKYTIPERPSKNTIATIYLKGGMKKVGAPDSEIRGAHNYPGIYFVDNSGPSNTQPGDQMVAIGDSEWVCFSRNATGERTLTELTVNGAFALPANFGFIVVEGSVTIDGVTATVDNFFRPRTIDLSGNGNARLVLVQ